MQNELINVLERIAVTLEEMRKIADKNNELKEKVKELEVKINYLEAKMNEPFTMPTPTEDSDNWWRQNVTMVNVDDTTSSKTP